MVRRAGKEMLDRRLEGDELCGRRTIQKKDGKYEAPLVQGPGENRVGRGRLPGPEVRRSWGQSVGCARPPCSLGVRGVPLWGSEQRSPWIRLVGFNRAFCCHAD